MTVVIGTAGHIDHGKTALLHALTGVDADRLPEEQRRGMTIDVGYAHVSPDGGPEVDFVDVPGHDRLVGNMLVGAGEIDAGLLVIAADDGPRPQTYEHLGLLDALGIRHGVAAVTKIDLAEPARVRDVVREVADLLARTGLAGAPIVAVSAVNGAGLEELRAALAALRDRLAGEAPRRLAPRGSRLAIDRAFSVRGRGAVVTGSARGPRLHVGDLLVAQPGGARLRVRGIQVHDREVDEGPEGGRVALNLAGAGAADLRRGQLLVSATGGDRDVYLTDRLLVGLRAPARLPGRPAHDPWPPADAGQARLHLGTAQADARVGRSGRDDLLFDDGLALAMLQLDRPIATAVGDRFVLRRPRPAALLAGGLVLDPAPPRGRSRRRQTSDTARRLIEAVGHDDPDGVEEALLQLHGLRATGGRVRLAPDVEALASSAVLEAVAAHHAAQADEMGPSLAAVRAIAAAAVRQAVTVASSAAASAAARVVDALLADGALQRAGEQVRAPGHTPSAPDPARARAMQRLVEVLDRPAPPGLSAAMADVACPPDALRELERDGRIIVVDADLAWSADAYASLRATALGLARQGPLTPAALRDATGTSRKYVMALLEDMDRRGILRRTPAGHVPGPRG